jgi:pro-apoptotic serine protease NMA111
LDRPAKLFKAQTPGVKENGEKPHAQRYEMETDSEDDLLPVLATATADSAEWQETIERVVRNVVSIHFCQTCSFDTDAAVSSEATGFVVDAERGYILTNRHVVGAGPFWGYCIFDNHEEV